MGFLDEAKNSEEVVNLIEQLRNAIVFYQVGRNYEMLTSVNTIGTDIAATGDILSNTEFDCEAALNAVDLRADSVPGLTKSSFNASLKLREVSHDVLVEVQASYPSRDILCPWRRLREFPSGCTD